MLLALCSALSFFSAQRCLSANRMFLFTKVVAEWVPGVKVNMQKFNGVAPEIGTWCRREGSGRGWGRWLYWGPSWDWAHPAGSWGAGVALRSHHSQLGERSGPYTYDKQALSWSAVPGRGKPWVGALGWHSLAGPSVVKGGGFAAQQQYGIGCVLSNHHLLSVVLPACPRHGLAIPNLHPCPLCLLEFRPLYVSIEILPGCFLLGPQPSLTRAGVPPRVHVGSIPSLLEPSWGSLCPLSCQDFRPNLMHLQVSAPIMSPSWRAWPRSWALTCPQAWRKGSWEANVVDSLQTLWVLTWVQRCSELHLKVSGSTWDRPP